MLRFVLSALVPFIGLGGSIGWYTGRFGVLRPSEVVMLIILLVVIPAATIWVTANFVELIRRAPVVRCSDRPRIRLLAGIVTGLLSLAGVMNVLADFPSLPDGVVVAACTLLSSTIVLFILPRQRPGRCRGCGYDIRGSLCVGRCPECGMTLCAA